MPWLAWMSSYIDAALPVLRVYSQDCEYCHGSLLPQNGASIHDLRLGSELCFLHTIYIYLICDLINLLAQ